MKLNEITEVTEKNFDEMENELFQYECRRSKERAAWRVGSAVGDILFFPFAFCAIYVMQEIFFSSYLLTFVVTLAGTPLAAFIAHLLAATVTRLVYRGKSSITFAAGSGLERAKALLERAKAVRNSIPKSFVSWLGILMPLGIILYAIVTEGPKLVDEYGLLGRIALPVAIIIFIVVCAIPYFVYYELCARMYRTFDGIPGLATALEKYVGYLQRGEEDERNRQRGDELYYRAVSGGEVDKNLVAEAAGLGSRPACLYMGQWLMGTWTAAREAGSYTQAEMKEMAEAGRDYFKIARLDESFPEQLQTEAQLGYLVFWAFTEDDKKMILTYLLNQLRKLRESGKLSRSQEDICDEAIRKVVDAQDSKALKEEMHRTAMQPSLDAVVARMNANAEADSMSWIYDDIDIHLDDADWRNAE